MDSSLRAACRPFAVGPRSSVITAAPAARVLFEQRYEFGTAQTIPNYAVTPDGQQFVMVKPEPGPSRFSVVLNAFDDLTAFAPHRHLVDQQLVVARHAGSDFSYALERGQKPPLNTKSGLKAHSGLPDFDRTLHFSMDDGALAFLG